MTFKEMLLELGFTIEDNKLFINIDNAILDCYPTRLIDDGMGYGIDEQYIIECSSGEKDGTPYIHIFTESYNETRVKELLEEQHEYLKLVKNCESYE